MPFAKRLKLSSLPPKKPQQLLTRRLPPQTCTQLDTGMEILRTLIDLIVGKQTSTGIQPDMAS